MTKTTLFSAALLFIAVVFGIILSTQPSESLPAGAGTVSWVKFDDAFEIARRENKKILVDVYTDWCGWCKKMDSEVYASEPVARILGTSFISVKVNAESSDPITFRGQGLTEEQFARGAGVTGYPTTLFLDQEGTPITIVPGFHPSDRFSSILKYIGEDHYKTISFQEFQERSTRTSP